MPPFGDHGFLFFSSNGQRIPNASCTSASHASSSDSPAWICTWWVLMCYESLVLWDLIISLFLFQLQWWLSLLRCLLRRPGVSSKALDYRDSVFKYEKVSESIRFKMSHQYYLFFYVFIDQVFIPTRLTSTAGRMICEFCGWDVVTQLKYIDGTMVWVICASLGLLG